MNAPRHWKPGDIAACYGADAASRLITWGTASVFGPRGLRLGPSHVAILAPHLRDDDLLWIESTSFCRRPCLFHQERVQGCQAHDPDDRVEDYETAGGRVECYRLTAIREFSAEERALLGRILLRHCVGQSLTYDLAGAIVSGTRLLRFTRLFPAADLHSLFCSELIAAVLQRLGRLNNSNPARYSPARLLRELVDSGVYQRVDNVVPPLKLAEVQHAA